MAIAPQAFPLAFHADVWVVDEPRRTVVLRAHHQEVAALRAPLRQRARRRYQGLGRDVEREPETLRLAQNRRADPRTTRCLLHRRQPRHRMPHQLRGAPACQDTSRVLKMPWW